jgi:Hint domain
MRNSGTATKCLLILVAALVLLPLACKSEPTPTPTPAVYSAPQLEYLLISNFGGVFYCDPDFYPVAHEGQELANALEQLPTIRANAAEFSAILEHLSLPIEADYTDQEKLLIYREHKKLTYGVELTAFGDIYNFTLRVGEGQGYLIVGTITLSGTITVLKQETSFNTCPICLAKGTLIDTPAGLIPVEQLQRGMAVWSVDDSGKRVSATLIETAVTPVPSSFHLVTVRLSDGRTVTASPGHPTAEGRPLGDYQVGDSLDGALVISVESVTYREEVTYDILPSGTTGLYWANGILLRSTLSASQPTRQ